MSDDHTAEVGRLRPAGAWFVAASVLWWIAAAALIPDDDYFVGDTTRDEALSIAEHTGLFRAFHVLAAVGTVAGVVGVLLVARRLSVTKPSRLADAAAIVAAVGLLAWLAEIAIRTTATVADARDVAAGLATPDYEPAIGSWAVFAIAAVGFLAPMLCAWALARRRLPGRRSSMIVAGIVTLVTVAGVATLAPSVIYQFGLLPLGVTLVVARRHTTDAGAAPAVGSIAT